VLLPGADLSDRAIAWLRLYLATVALRKSPTDDRQRKVRQAAREQVERLERVHSLPEDDK
jgi:hypothetical protein